MKGVVIDLNFPEASLGSWEKGLDYLKLTPSAEVTKQLMPSFCFRIVCSDASNFFRFRFFGRKRLIYPKFYERFSLFSSTNLKDWKKISFTRKIYSREDYVEIEFYFDSQDFYLASYPVYPFLNLDRLINQFSQLENTSVSLGDVFGSQEVICEIKKGYFNKKVLIIVGQHPGEIVSYFFLEGILDHLIKKIKENSLPNVGFIICFWIPSRLLKSHRYVNGVDLNRTWKNPLNTLQRKIQGFISEKYVDVVIDVHGDEVSKTNYIESYYSQKEDFQSILKSFPRVTSNPVKNFIKRLLFGIKTERGASLVSFSRLNRLDSILIELSMVGTSPSQACEFGKDLITDICKIVKSPHEN